MSQFNSLCEQFAHILKGKSEIKNGVCSVNFKRNIRVTVQGKKSRSVVPAGVAFESLDHEGHALNLGEIAILEEEVPLFSQSLLSQGIIISALHNHWLFTQPTILYIHFQSIEPPLSFAQKVARSFSYLSSYPGKD